MSSLAGGPSGMELCLQCQPISKPAQTHVNYLLGTASGLDLILTMPRDGFGYCHLYQTQKGPRDLRTLKSGSQDGFTCASFSILPCFSLPVQSSGSLTQLYHQHHKCHNFGARCLQPRGQTVILNTSSSVEIPFNDSEMFFFSNFEIAGIRKVVPLSSRIYNFN